MAKSGKIWGVTEAIEVNPLVEMHRIEVNAGHRCSVHKHNYKWNGFFVEKGELVIEIYRENSVTDQTILRAGDYTAIKPGLYHCFVCTENSIAFELYWPEPMGDQDIDRLDQGTSLTDEEMKKFRSIWR